MAAAVAVELSCAESEWCLMFHVVHFAEGRRLTSLIFCERTRGEECNRSVDIAFPLQYSLQIVSSLSSCAFK